MKQFFYAITLFSITFLACAQNTSTQSQAGQPVADPTAMRRIMENPVTYPADQTLELKPLETAAIKGVPRMAFSGYVDGAFRFDKQTGLDKDEPDPYPNFNFYFDNYEPQVRNAGPITWDLPEGDHIVAAAILDEQGFVLKYPTACDANMIRIKQGEIIKTANAGVMIYYNHPRKAYATGEAVYLDFLVTMAPLDPNYQMFVLVDNQRFEVAIDKTYEILGLKPGNHMVELQMFRFGELFNKPLNPSRMTFSTE
jgi:hypothetical protein